MRVLALTGVPGTGKSSIAQQVEEIHVVEANELAERAEAIDGTDDRREVAIVDEQRLAEASPALLPEEGPVLVEGHLAHHCHADAVLLLRCHPEELRRRLELRGWPREKIEENVMAETLDALVTEIATRPAGEVDTTERDPDELAHKVEQLFRGQAFEASWLDPLGTADWTHTLAGDDQA